jgi:Putative peptidoglycan binding domain
VSGADASSSVQRVSGRYDDPDVLPEEDDWFADPPSAPWDPPSAEEQEWPGDFLEPPPPPAGRTDSRRAGLIVAGVTVAVAVFAVGVLVVRAIGGSDEPTTPTVVTTAPTVPDTTLPDATTPDTTVPDTTTPDTTTPTGSTTLPEGVTLRPGDTGDNVIALQEALAQAGYDPGSVDGDYGPATTQAVAAFQTAAGLTVDGIAGPETLAALSAAVATG